jgi:hypothetical protein
MCGVVEYGSMCDGKVGTDEKERKEERVRYEQDGVSCGLTKGPLESWNGGQQHHCEGGRVRTEESDWVETFER